MSHDSGGGGLVAMIERLWRLFVTAYWVFMFVFIPMYVARHIVKAIGKRRAAEESSERIFWSVRIGQDLCVLYFAVTIYFHIFKDFLPISDGALQKMTEWFEFAAGIPGLLWQAIIESSPPDMLDASRAESMTLIIVLGVFFVLLAIDYLDLYGRLSLSGEWHPPKRISRRINEQFDRDEAASRAISKQLYDQEMMHPSNHPSWVDLPAEQQEVQVAKWKEEREELWKRKSECPRSAYFDKK